MVKNAPLIAFFFIFIWSYQKKAVFLHPLSKKALLNGVMVALQILVLSVWVRVLVEQHRKVPAGDFFVVIPTRPQVLISLRSNDYFSDTTLCRLFLRNLRVLVEQHRKVPVGDFFVVIPARPQASYLVSKYIPLCCRQRSSIAEKRLG